MTRNDVPQPRETVDETPPVGVEQKRPLSAHPDMSGRLVKFPIMKRMNEVREILLEQLGF